MPATIIASLLRGETHGMNRQDELISHNINQMVLESKLPHKIVNFLFTVTNSNNKLTVL